MKRKHHQSPIRRNTLFILQKPNIGIEKFNAQKNKRKNKLTNSDQLESNLMNQTTHTHILISNESTERKTVLDSLTFQFIFTNVYGVIQIIIISA